MEKSDWNKKKICLKKQRNKRFFQNVHLYKMAGPKTVQLFKKVCLMYTLFCSTNIYNWYFLSQVTLFQSLNYLLRISSTLLRARAHTAILWRHNPKRPSLLTHAQRRAGKVTRNMAASTVWRSVRCVSNVLPRLNTSWTPVSSCRYENVSGPTCRYYISGLDTTRRRDESGVTLRRCAGTA